jgi:SnoaL-like domain
MSQTDERTLTREWYEGFQRADFDRWDAVMADDVLLNSTVGFGYRGLGPFKEFAQQFTDLAYRIDLVDEHLALNGTGTGRGFITFCLYWKHVKEFLGIAPSGREGTSIETLLLTIEDGKVTRMDLACNTVDLVLYEWERGWPSPHNVKPPALVEGIDRSASITSSIVEVNA